MLKIYSKSKLANNKFASNNPMGSINANFDENFRNRL